MSCPCPSGYTPTIDSDDCIYTITAATSGGTFFYTATTGSQSSSYSNLGVIFYEDVTNLSFPITNSGTTASAYTQNGTLLFNTEFLIDNSGRILNIQAGGQDGGYSGCFVGPISSYYGPLSIQNSLWGSSTLPPFVGRLNNAGIWSTVNPGSQWIGFSYCLDIPIQGTYLIGFGGDDRVRFKINGELIYESSSVSYCTSIPQTLNTNTWTVLPYTFNSGLNIIEVEGLNISSLAAFAAEIYSGSVATLSGYTSYSQLSADTIFTTLNLIGQDIPLSSSGATSNTGYTCPSGYTLYTCSGTPYCIQIDRQPIVNYCVNDTGLGYDDYFKYGGIHNSEPYWSGETNGYVIYYTTGGTWCLSTILDGTCLLEGPDPCNSVCPDLCDTYVFSGACPTPTPTPTVNCSVLDFNAIFDCEVTPTPSITPTISTTPTMTPTPSPSDPCGGRAIDVTISGYTPTPTATSTPTPTPTPQITRPCSVSGTVVFNTIDGQLKSPSSKQFQDCYTGEMYYTTNSIPLPSGGTISQFMIFKASVNGNSKCISFLGYNLDTIGVDSISLVTGPLGYSNVGQCSLCVPDVSPTPTATVTPSVTPTMTPTPTPSMLPGYYVYRQCGNPTEYVIQTLAIPTFTPNQVFKTIANDLCWEYMYYSSTYPTLPLGSTFTYVNGSFFPSSGNTFFNTCVDCLVSL
jgi:hypothetical protein